jgi:hypothetical protein
VRDLGIGGKKKRSEQRIERVHERRSVSLEMRALATRTPRRPRFAGSDGTIAGPQEPP